jgi:hypothetical protein
MSTIAMQPKTRLISVKILGICFMLIPRRAYN